MLIHCFLQFLIYSSIFSRELYAIKRPGQEKFLYIFLFYPVASALMRTPLVKSHKYQDGFGAKMVYTQFVIEEN